MKVQFPQSFDFNQMLVFSVFWHLMVLTVVLFLPKPTFQENTVVPAFMVNLVSEPTGFKSAAQKRSESLARDRKAKARKKGVEKKTAPKKSKKLKKTTASKPAEVKKVPTVKTPKSNGVLEALNKLEGKIALTAPNVVEELAQVARLEKPQIKPSPAKPIKQKPITGKTFRELETLKSKKIKDKKAVVPVPLHKDILEDFEELKMEESLSDTHRKETSPEKPQKTVPEKKEPEKPQAPEVDLLKKLEQLAKLDAAPVLVPDVETEELGPAEGTWKGSESYDSIIEKFDSLPIESQTIKVEISSARLDSSSFQSKMRTLPKASQATTEPGTGDSYVFAKKGGTPGADVQSLYVGMIQEKIYRNWQEPLAQEHNQEVLVSFFLFPRGNIDKTVVKQSSGVEALDTLAVKAVLDSVPFPKFPKELKKFNLHVNIYFKYVPKEE